MGYAVSLCPSPTDMSKWKTCVKSGTTMKGFVSCVGCGKLLPYSSCASTLADMIGATACSNMPPLLKQTCNVPIGAVVNQGCPTTKKPTNKPTIKK